MEPYSCRGWFEKGSRPSVKAVHTNERLSVFGAMSEDDCVYMVIEERCNAQTWINFLKYLLSKCKKVLIVIDGARYHFEKEHVQKFYVENAHRLVVVELPPYSPELNPIEQMWKKIKKFLATKLWFYKGGF